MAEFAQLIDSLNQVRKPEHGKKYRFCLQEDSPHFELWNKLPEMTKWKLLQLISGEVSQINTIS